MATVISISFQILAKVEVEGEHPVIWTTDVWGNHTVTDGSETETFDKADSFAASQAFGEFLYNTLQCAGAFHES